MAAVLVTRRHAWPLLREDFDNDPRPARRRTLVADIGADELVQ